MTILNLGFIGLGIMGAPMATHLGAAGLSKGKVFVDISSIDPMATKAFAKQINALGCEYLDAPVTGGDVGAMAATLTIVVDGPQAAFDRFKSLFELMEKTSHRSAATVMARPVKLPTRSSLRSTSQQSAKRSSLRPKQALSAKSHGTPVWSEIFAENAFALIEPHCLFDMAWRLLVAYTATLSIDAVCG